VSQVLLEQGDLALLKDPVAEELLHSTQPARLAYTWRDGTPRVVAIWFHWDGRQIVMATPVRAPKLKVLPDRPDVALVIDDASSWPNRELMIRGRAELQPWQGIVPEYALAAKRYLGEEQAEAMLAGITEVPSVRIAVTPTWAGIIDFESRWPSALPTH
jgi:Pyridoxamine 5'-phosphate oxidase